MRARITFRETNLAASRLGSWISKAFNHKTKIKNPAALTIALLITALVIVVFSVNASGWFAKPSSTRRPILSAAQDRPTVSSLEAILITLQPYGFEPTEVTLKAGPFLLAIDNRSGIHEPVFRVDRTDGGRLREVRTAKGRLALRQVVDLPPGDYVLTEAIHPDWICQITITPR
ncbi:MAG: hypothetical protein ACREA2_15365 [Blastocatellia bacterium]